MGSPAATPAASPDHQTTQMLAHWTTQQNVSRSSSSALASDDNGAHVSSPAVRGIQGAEGAKVGARAHPGQTDHHQLTEGSSTQQQGPPAAIGIISPTAGSSSPTAMPACMTAATIPAVATAAASPADASAEAAAAAPSPQQLIASAGLLNKPEPSFKYGEGIIHEPVYQTDAFRMHVFKVLACSNRSAHDCEWWLVCLGV